MISMLKGRKGQSMVEFALIVPLLLILVLGIEEFGRAWMTKNILTGATREAVRIMAVTGNNAAASARADNVLRSSGITTANISVTNASVAYDPVSVTVTYNFPILFQFIPGLNRASIPLSSTTTMRREY